MPSADRFLRVLEEKDLVSAEVLQAARDETQRHRFRTTQSTSPCGSFKANISPLPKPNGCWPWSPKKRMFRRSKTARTQSLPAEAARTAAPHGHFC